MVCVLGLALLIQHFQWEAVKTTYTFYLPFVSQENPPTPTAVPPVATVIPQTPPLENSSTAPTGWGLGIILLFVFLIIGAAILEGKRDRLSQFSPEQQRALRMQNNAAGLWAIVMLSGFCGCSLFSEVQFLQGVFPILWIGIVLLGGVIWGFVALSSIFSEASILRPRWQRDFSKGQQAIWEGAWLLFFLGFALCIWLLSLGN